MSEEYRNPCMGLEFEVKGDNPSTGYIADALKWINTQIYNADYLGVKNVKVFETIRAALTAQTDHSLIYKWYAKRGAILKELQDVNAELLEALKQIIQIHRDYADDELGSSDEAEKFDAVIIARKAIARAERKGQSHE